MKSVCSTYSTKCHYSFFGNLNYEILRVVQRMHLLRLVIDQIGSSSIGEPESDIVPRMNPLFPLHEALQHLLP